MLKVQAVFFSFLVATACMIQAIDTKEVNAKQQQIIRQGGYEEKVDPTIDYKSMLPRIKPCEPAGSQKRFVTREGFSIQLAASEPQIADSVDIAFDENGRIFVAEMIPYSENSSIKFGSPNGRISLLEDADGDGFFEKSTVYADGLVWPTGVLPYDGGVFIAAAPDLWYFKDTDGDGKADVREKVLTGYGIGNPNELPSSLRFGLDNRIHIMTSLEPAMIEPLMWEKHLGKKVDPVSAKRLDINLDPRTGEIKVESGGSQFGMAFDLYGRKFESWNSGPCQMVMYQQKYLHRNPFYAAPAQLLKAWKGGLTVYPISPPEPWRVVRTEMRKKKVFTGAIEGGGTPNGYFTAACGVTCYKGDAWPKEHVGRMFVCEGAGNLISRFDMRPEGVAFCGHRIDEKCEFINSDEIWFRPCQMANGPDGNLYIADMYREVFEIASAVPPSVKKHIDLSCGNDRGRIWRVVHNSNAKPRKSPNLGKVSTAELVALLEHPNYWHRNTAARLLFERQDKSAIGPLKKMAVESKSPLGRLHAICTLDGLEAIDEAVLIPALGDAEPGVRENAIILAEKHLDSSAFCEKLFEMVGDPDLRVKYQLAFTLGDLKDAKSTAALVEIARNHSSDRWIKIAIMTSCFGRSGQMFATLSEDDAWRKSPAGVKFLSDLAGQVGRENDRDALAAMLTQIDRLPENESRLIQSVVNSLCRSMRLSGGRNGDLLAESGRVSEVLEKMIEQSIELAENDDAKNAGRVAAIRSLSLAPFDEVADTLSEMVAARQPKAIQVAGIQTLGGFMDDGVSEIMIEAWGGFSPEVQNEAAEVLFARPERINCLLDALEEELIAPAQLDPARIQFLLKHSNADIAARAKDLLGSAKLARRDDVVKSYDGSLKMKGDLARGREIFRKECSICHRLENTGFDLGLPLGAIKDRGPETILLAVLDPNRDVQPRYLNYVILTDAGLSVTGMIGSETATSVTLQRAEGESNTVLRANIDEMQNTGMSIMPEGLEKQIDQQGMADLIEYLMNIE
jgi:putative membrane-bound dehydrogenase-like protein